MENTPYEAHRKLLYGDKAKLEQEIITRVHTYTKFKEVVESDLVPLTEEQNNFVKLGATLGARTLKAIINDANLTLIPTEELTTMMDFVDRKLSEENPNRHEE